MLVGDSMNRNQFESILCLLREPLPDKSKMYEARGHKVSKGRSYFNFVIEVRIEKCQLSLMHYIQPDDDDDDV